MKHIQSILLFALFLLSPLAAAQGVYPALHTNVSLDDLFALGQYIGPGKVNLDIAYNPNACVVITPNAIDRPQEGFCSDAKGTIHVNQVAYDAIAKAPDQRAELLAQFKKGNVWYEPHDLVEAIRAILIGLFKGFI